MLAQGDGRSWRRSWASWSSARSRSGSARRARRSARPARPSRSGRSATSSTRCGGSIATTRRSSTTSMRSRRTSSPTPRSSWRPPSRGSCQSLAGRPARGRRRCSGATRSTCSWTTRSPPGAPVVFEDLPTQPNLLGRVEHAAQMGALVTDFTLIRAGALHRANGGYLVLDARRLLTQPFAWEELKRALRAGEIRIESLGDRLGLATTVSLEPEPIPLDAKVVLVGDRDGLLPAGEPRPGLPRAVQGPGGLRGGGAAPARRPSSATRSCWARSRPAPGCGRWSRGRSPRSSTRRHASPATPSGCPRTCAGSRTCSARRTTGRRKAGRAAGHRRGHRTGALDAQRRRASRIHERSLEEIARGTMLVSTTGEAVGVANGLSVISLGEVAFGRPTRITARARLGDGELVDIEREVHLGGPIHSKGVLILAGFLGGRYGRDAAAQPPGEPRVRAVLRRRRGRQRLAGSRRARCCRRSAEVPLRQSIAMTGSLNQHGEVQPIGGVNEKIEGFFDVCAARGLDGTHGVIIPATNLPHLMLRADVVEAVRAGRFNVWAVATDRRGAGAADRAPGRRARPGRRLPGGVGQRACRGRAGGPRRACPGVHRAPRARSRRWPEDRGDEAPAGGVVTGSRRPDRSDAGPEGSSARVGRVVRRGLRKPTIHPWAVLVPLSSFPTLPSACSASPRASRTCRAGCRRWRKPSCLTRRWKPAAGSASS